LNNSNAKLTHITAKSILLRGVYLMLFVLLTTGSVRAQQKYYAITAAGINIGTLSIKRTAEADLTRYEMSTHIKLWLLFTIVADYDMTAIYRGDQLISSKSKTHTNKGDFSASTEWDGHQYRIKIDAYKYKKDTLIAEPIHFNVGRMYYDKPSPGQKIYADNFGLLTPAGVKGDEVVVRILGNANTYFYSGKIMSEASMYHPVKNYKVKLVTNPPKE